ncbi:hypothetical protein [Clostridium botulinum]|nr:hypothetical protein [Clostridium botulinum]
MIRYHTLFSLVFEFNLYNYIYVTYFIFPMLFDLYFNLSHSMFYLI